MSQSKFSTKNSCGFSSVLFSFVSKSSAESTTLSINSDEIDVAEEQTKPKKTEADSSEIPTVEHHQFSHQTWCIFNEKPHKVVCGFAFPPLHYSIERAGEKCLLNDFGDRSALGVGRGREFAVSN
jgi:hypothetical protein